MVFQEPMTALDPVFKVGEVLRELLSLDGLRGGAARIRALALLEEVRIPDPVRCFKSPPHLLSGGMRQRVVLAMALARSPQVLLADEPTTALDTVTRNAIMDLLESMCTRRDLGMLLITHDLSLVAKRVHRLIVMCAGCVCEAGSAQAILADPRHPYTRGLLGCRLSVERRFDHLGHLSDVIDDPGAWAPQTTAEGQATPFWPHARPGGPVDRQPSAVPRLVMVGDDHMLAV
jgi:ABC-type dipeptide/oligopeptide/nickel transport system ATPase component